MLVLYCNVTSESHMILSIIICYFTFTEHHDCCFSDTLLNCLHLNSYNVHLPPNILHLAFIYARNQTWKDSWTVSLSLRLSQCRCRLQVNDAGDDSPGQASPPPPPPFPVTSCLGLTSQDGFLQRVSSCIVPRSWLKQWRTHIMENVIYVTQ